MAHTSPTCLSQLPASSSPPPHRSHDSPQGLNNSQSILVSEGRPRLPRVPRPTAACPRPWTLDQIYDWFEQSASIGLRRTYSERGDYDECERQFCVIANESPTDTEDDEDEEDERTPPPVQLYPTRRKTYQRPLTPPRNPPHLKQSTFRKAREPNSVLKPNTARIEKVEANTRTATRRPITRSQGNPMISLHHRKGYIRYWPVDWRYIVVSYDKYLRDYVSSVLHSHAAYKPVLTLSSGRRRSA